MLAARDERDILSGFRQQAAEIAADPACAHDGDAHDTSNLCTSCYLTESELSPVIRGRGQISITTFIPCPDRISSIPSRTISRGSRCVMSAPGWMMPLSSS